jgi:hypothetical protein
MWACACTVVDPHDNEWVMYVDVPASTKNEAIANATRVCGARGVAATDVVPVACPDRKVEPLPIRALPEPATEPATDAAPFFATSFFTRYRTTAVVANGGDT